MKVVDTVEEQKAFGVAYAKGILEYFGIEYKEGKDTNVAIKNKLVLTIDKKEYTINGQVKKADVAPFIQDGRTQVSIALLREFGFTVEWNEGRKEVSILWEK